MALGAVGGLGVLVWFVVSNLFERPPARTRGEYAVEKRPTPAVSRVPRASSPTRADPGPSEPTLLAELNIAVVAQEVARLRGTSGGSGARRAQARLEELASPELLAQPYLQADDEIVGVDEFDLRSMSKMEAANFLTKKFERIEAGTSVRFRLMRQGVPHEVVAYYPVPIGLGEAEELDRVAITPEVAQEIQQRVWGIGKYYQATYYTPEEKATIDRVLSRSEATPSEWDFISAKVLRGGVENEVKTEQDHFRARLASLQAKIDSMALPDYLVQKDGRRLEGRFIEAVETHIKIETSYGRVTIYREDIREVIEGKEVRDEFKKRLTDAVKYPQEAYPQMLAWTRNLNLPVHHEYVAYLMLMRDPADRLARLAARYTEGTGGAWKPPPGEGDSAGGTSPR